jgi:lipopolysaccharide export system protein LptA
MKVRAARAAWVAALGLALAGALAHAPAAATKPAASTPLLPGTNSKAPISIEADKLVYYDKEQKAVYTGNVVVIQGDTKMTCAAMTIFMEKAPQGGAGDAAKGPDVAKPGDAAKTGGDAGKIVNAAKTGGDAAKTADATKTGGDGGPGAGSSHVKHLDAVGPVTILSKTQVATGDNASYDKAQNMVWLTGNVTLSDGGNVTKGDKLTYDLTSGQATVDTGPATKRVKGLFIPGSASGDDDKSKAEK